MAVAEVYGAVPTATVRDWTEVAVYVKRAWTDAWTWVPYLWPLQAYERVAPAVSRALLQFDYGDLIRQCTGARATYSWLTINGGFLAIVGYNAYGEFGIWHGVVRAEDGAIFGSATPMGEQAFTAFGLEHLLEREPVNLTYTDNGAIGRMIKFNAESGRGLDVAGNRSTNVNADGVYVVSPDGEQWTNRQLGDYLLKYFATHFGVTYVLSGQLDALDAIVEEHDPGNWTSVKTALDDLISRHRGLGWRIWTNGSGYVQVYVFSLLSEPLWAGTTLFPANWNQTELYLEGVFDTEAVFRFDEVATYGYVHVMGGPVRVCASFSYADGTLEAGWTAEEEATYKAGSSKAEPTTQDHDVARKSDALSNVYQLFRVPANWNWIAGDGEGGVAGAYAVPAIGKDGALDFSTCGTYLNLDHRFERALPILEPGDDGGQPNYRKPFILVKDEGTDNWEYAERIKKRPMGLEISDREMAIKCRPKINHVLAKYHWDEDEEGEPYDPAPAATQTDPMYDWQDVITTQSFKTDVILAVEIGLGFAGPVKLIHAPEYQSWIILPDTVLDVEDGALVRAATGVIHIMRSDVDELGVIGMLAASWYGRSRATMALTLKQISPALPAGTMVRGALGRWYAVDIATVISERVWDFESQQMQIQTGYDELNFAAMGANAK